MIELFLNSLKINLSNWKKNIYIFIDILKYALLDQKDIFISFGLRCFLLFFLKFI